MDIWTQQAIVSRAFLVDYKRLQKKSQTLGKSEYYRLQERKNNHEWLFNEYMWNHPESLDWMDWVVKPKTKETKENKENTDAKHSKISSPGEYLASGLFLYDPENIDNTILPYDDDVNMSYYSDCDQE